MQLGPPFQWTLVHEARALVQNGGDIEETSSETLGDTAVGELGWNLNPLPPHPPGQESFQV